jgi:hypothetical protein
MRDPLDAEIRNIDPTSDLLKFDLRVGDEIGSLGCVGAFVIRFVLIWVVQIPAESIWQSKVGADVGGAVPPSPLRLGPVR